MTALADLLKPADRRRLLEHLAEADDLDRLMRQPGGLPSVPEPPPLHRAGRDTRICSTNQTENFSTSETKNFSTGRTTAP